MGMIPTALDLDCYPVAGSDFADFAGKAAEIVPSAATRFDDSLVSFEDPIGEMVLAKKLPDVFDGIEFGTIGRKEQEAYVVRYQQLAAGLMPSGAVEDEDGVVPGLDLGGDLGQVQVHGLGIGVGQNQGGADVTSGAHGAEDVRPGVAGVLDPARPGALLGPNVGQGSLLPDTGLVLPPQFERPLPGMLRDRGGDQVREVFLCASRA